METFSGTFYTILTGIDNELYGLIKPLQGFIEMKFFLLVLTLKTS